MKLLNKSHMLIVIAIMLTGCSAVRDIAWAYADHVDSADPCQTQEFSPRTGARLHSAGYTWKDMPDFCGSARSRQTIVNAQGRAVGYIK
jgi:hypothetical protein